LIPVKHNITILTVIEDTHEMRDAIRNVLTDENPPEPSVPTEEDAEPVPTKE